MRDFAPSNGRSGEIRYTAEYALLHMRRNAALAIAAHANGWFVRRLCENSPALPS